MIAIVNVGVAELAKKTEVLGEVGVSKGDKTESSTFKKGSAQSYRIAKLKRDYPDITGIT